MISTFLAAYYGKAAPFVRLYMDTMHGSVADTSYFMREGFALDAAFLSPIALLTSAGAFVDGRAVVSGLELERLNRSSMAVYYVVLMRWAELDSFARTENLKWPLEATIEAAFEVFASAYNTTTTVYAGKHRVPPSLHEGAAGSLASIRSSLFNPAATCSSGISTAKLPLSVKASGWVTSLAIQKIIYDRTSFLRLVACDSMASTLPTPRTACWDRSTRAAPRAGSSSPWRCRRRQAGRSVG